MESHHRKLFRKPNVSENNTLCPNNCHPNESCFTGPIQIMPPPLLRPPPKQSTINEKHMLQNSLIITASMVGCAFLFLIFMVLKYYNSRRNNQIIRNSSNQFDRSQEFFDEERGVVIDHPFWYIITPGLGRSVIDSITVCKYKKDEGLIDGTECSVCLLEFEQDESLRLLPKCSHAFHISCIDTWLSSHQNCPLCRAPIVCENANIGQLSVPDPGFNPSSSQREEETQLENLDNNNHDQVGEEESSEEIRVEERKNKQNSMKGLCNSSPVLRILTDKELIRGEEIQPITRSVSLDSSSALRIYHDVGSVISDQGSSKSIVKKSQLGTVSKQENKNLSLDKLMKSSSMGNSLQKRSILMKRSFSSSRKKKNFNQIPCRSLNSNLS